MTEAGFGALLMAPIIFRWTTVGLLEAYRRAARPWTSAQIDQTRLLAHCLGGAIHVDRGGAPSWSPASVTGQRLPAG